MDIDVDIDGKSFAIFGLPDSGKSTFANYLLATLGPSAFVYDTVHEYPLDKAYTVYRPTDRRNPAELEAVIRTAVFKNPVRRWKYFIIDEANIFCPSKPAPLPRAVADLNDLRAHYGVALGSIARRPVQLNQDLTDLAHYLFIFKLSGKHDIDYLNNISAGMGDAAGALLPYHFVIRHPNGTWNVSEPIGKEYATDKKL